MTGPADRPNWLAAIRRYLLAVGFGNLGWEFAQMPFYGLWQTGTWGEIVSAGLHCALGDLGIAAGVLALALALAGTPAWPVERLGSVLLIMMALGTAFTVYSEHLNVTVRHAWSYAPAMPVLPVLGIGFTPLAQWLVVPPLALLWAAHPYPPGKRLARGQ